MPRVLSLQYWIIAMNYRIIHKTQYSYSGSVNLCYNEARLTPRSFVHQHCRDSQFVVDPKPGTGVSRTSGFLRKYRLLFHNPAAPSGTHRYSYESCASQRQRDAIGFRRTFGLGGSTPAHTNRYGSRGSGVATVHPRLPYDSDDA